MITSLSQSHKYNAFLHSLIPSVAVRNVEFCIQELNQDLSVKFENRVLSLDSGSDCKLKVSLHAKINLVGVKWAQPDTTKDNGDPDKNDSDIDSGNKAIKEAYNTMLDELISPDANSDSSKKSILDAKRKKIIEAIKAVCQDCCCNRKDDDYCVKPTDISQAVKQVCASCCCKSTEPCVDSSRIMDEVKKLCVDCCCKKEDCCGTEGVLSQIGEFCVCLIKDAKEKLDDCKCSGCSACQENCIDKQKLKKEIEQLCSCSEAKKVVEQAAQKCDSCKGSGSCQCCQEAKKQFESCPCMACNLKTAIDEIKGKDDSNCCNSSSCSCSDPNCRKRTDVLDALKTYCKCKDQVKQIKEKIEPLCQSCKKRECCDVKNIESQIKSICENCDCKQMNCCDEGKIKSNVKTVIESKCTCKKQVCCFNKVTDANQSLNTDEQGKLKKIALAIFKYFRPPIAYETGVMTLKSTKDIDLEFLSSSSNEKITVDSKNNNALKIPKQAFKDLIASAKMHENKVKDFHPNSMLSIKFHGITLTFCTLSGEGFCIDGYSINGSFSMQLGYLPAGIFTRNSANWRKKTGSKPNEKHDLSWSLTQPLIDPSKCSCSILSDPLFGTVFGAICISISIVQFIIALFVSQGYYDGFQSYMDAVRSGFSWPTQYDNVVKSVFCGCFLNAIGPSFFADDFSGGSVQSVRVLVGTQNVNGTSFRQVEFCIEQLEKDLSVKFENRVLSLDSKSVCKLKVSLAAKIVLYGVKWAQPDVSKENGDPDKNGSDSDSDITDINSAHNKMLEQLVTPTINNLAITNNDHKAVMDKKRKNIIDAIKAVCKDCCCNMTAEQYCIQPTDISEAVKQVCANCCCKNEDPCVDSSKIMEHVNKLCQNCCCKKDDCCGTKEVLSQIGEFCVCLIKEAKEKLENCTCSGCSSCQENCIDKQKLMKEIEQLCSCDKAKKVVENSAQKCDSCKGSGGSGCQCCQEAKKQFESCPCMACDLKRVIDGLQGSDGSNKCCSDSSCSCSSGSNCRTKADVLKALKTYCKCDTQRKEIKEKIEKLCKECKDKKCCDVSKIQSDIKDVIAKCKCKEYRDKCCNETQINEKVKDVIDKNCTCKKNKCCFNGVQNGTISNKAEQEKLKNIALAIFKYFRPPIAHETGVMTLKSTKDIELKFSSAASSQDNITVDANGNENVLKIPTQAFKSLMASSQIPQVKVTTFHKNTMLSIHFEEISLTFQKLNGTGFEIDGYPINGTFLMQLGYQPIGPYTKNSANMRKKTENEPKKHNLSWSIDNHYPQIDKNKCSCSILSNPLFGTVFGAICLTISIVQFIIALFVSQGYYDGFQSYMDAVRSGFSWPTQYDNVVSSIFCGCFLNAIGPSFFADDFSGGSVQSVRVLVGTQNVNGTSFRQVEFCIEQLEKDLSVKFENRVLSLDSKSVCKLKVSLAAKIVLYGVKWAQPDVSKENGDPDKNGSDSDSDITDINSAHNKMLEQLVTPTINNLAITNNDHKAVMDKKRKNIIDAIKAVCKDCCCNMTAEQYCIQPTDISEAVKQVCANCCCKNKDPCVDSSKIMEHVNKLCVDCCCKKQDCCNTKEVLSQIGDFCVCVIKEAKEKLENCTCDKCSSCKENCIDKGKLMKEIEQLCSCDKAKKVVENSAQNCDSCKGSGGSGCQCCQEAKKQFESCSCMACDLKRVIDDLQGSGENGSNKCCNNSSCPCSSDSDSNCRTKEAVLSALNAYCKCKDQVKQIKEKINGLCKHCNKNKCCDVTNIQSDIEQLCNSCPCKTQKKCCNENEIKSKVQQVIEKHCTCKKNKCCFNGVQNGDLSNKTDEQTKLKKIALTIFKYFRPPIAYTTGLMTLKSKTDIDLDFSSNSSSDDKITVDTSKNSLKIPKKAFQTIMASSQIVQGLVIVYHPNSMMSINFEEIILSFPKLCNEGFKIDGFPIHHDFSMKIQYGPAGPYTRPTANWRNKNSDKSKHELSWSLSYPQIDKNKCSCSILSDPLFGTVFGAICLTISIVQFIIALFVSQGYYDGFQSYMDAVRSGFSWPTQYDNVVSSIFWWLGIGVRNGTQLLLVHINTYDYFKTSIRISISPTLGTYEAVRVQVGTQNVNGTSFRQVEFCIEQLEKDLSVKFENRVLSLDSKSVCKLKVSLAAKIVLYGVKWAQPDVSKENGDPDKNGSDSDSDITDINSAHNKMLEQLVTPTINNLAITNNDHKAVMDKKRKNIIDAIKAVCKDCCCNRAEDYCIKPTDIVEQIKQVCASCCCKSDKPCVDSGKIMDEVNKLCVDCCCKKQDCCNTKEVLSQIGDFCVCVIKEAKEKLENCTCDKCSSCKENCIDKTKLMKEILKLCSCDNARIQLEEAAQNCDSCKGSGGSCQCCQEIQKKFKDCPCMACNLKRVIDEIQGSGENGSNCCDSSSCSCSSDSNSNCRKRTDVLKALNAYCKCKDQVKQIKEKIEKLCKQCNKNTCCDSSLIQNDIQKICNSCPCKQKKCCNESEINKKVQQVIESSCKCRVNKCCFRDITDGDLSSHSKEQAKLKNIAKAIFKYFRPPIAYETGVMTLESTTETELEFSSGGDEKITVDTSKNVLNTLKIPKQAFKDLMASAKMHENKVKDFHPNSMMSIEFHGITLTFCTLSGEGFKLDGYPIKGGFSMKMEYAPAGIFTRSTALWRKKNSDKHNLSWGISSNHPQIDPSKCSCSILSDPLFGTVFGAICLTISIVQFIIALFISQGYYDGFQSYMDAVRSGFSWPTQYDNVVNSVFWWLWIGVRNGSRLLLGLYKTDILVVVC
ncbi:uncharacterized protein BdWA1_004165 [Babesia duncani]|uniref:Uncharacterized protein n=1 Tax=Babesia duncani TaxID=323732 RepID=A0AAD9UM73_9APIC|nr:hypothetical protein BdWA1_004165 [Babesia duncani]